MGVIIKNMELPDDCRECPMQMYYMNCGQTWCRAENAKLADDYRAIPFEGRPEWCPLQNVHEEIMPVIKELESQYEKAKSIKYVNKPIAYSVYQTWKTFDGSKEKRE